MRASILTKLPAFVYKDGVQEVKKAFVQFAREECENHVSFSFFQNLSIILFPNIRPIIIIIIILYYVKTAAQ